MTEWIEKEVKISQIKKLLAEGYEVEVTSPDGWVGVNYFIEKGTFEEYVLFTENGYSVSCNKGHLFKSSLGWYSAENILSMQESTGHAMSFNTEAGWSKGYIAKTGKIVPIVDINVDHEEHRYFTNGIESHNTGVGKTMFMTHCAANHLNMGKNVLYITMEMSEERIAERIDANLMNITMDELRDLPKDSFNKKINRIKSSTQGKLIIKEYPTSSAGAAHFRHLLQELRIKKNFKPDVIYVDYLNICASTRMKMGGSVNSYMYIKSIAEELRGLAVEFDLPIITATQSNRDGYNSSDLGLDNTSESFGLPATVDFMFALMSTDELADMNQILVKQLKNRYSDINENKRFVIGVNKSKMRFYDVDESEQDNILEGPKKDKYQDKPVMDNTQVGIRANEEDSMKWMTKVAGRKDFSSLRMT